MKKELQLLGLTKNEAMVYEILVKYGSCKAGVIINKLDLHRNLIYRALEGLVQNGYATKIVRNGVWHFETTDPQSLLTSMRRKEQVFAEVLKEISLYHKNSQQQIIVHEGIESFRSFWIESIKRAPEGTIDYVAGGELKQWEKFLGPALAEYRKIADKKKIAYRVLYYSLADEEEREKVRDFVYKDTDSELRLWDKDISFFGNFNVLHDTVVLHTHGEHPRVIEMRDPKLVEMFQGYFNVMWDKAEKITLEKLEVS